MWFSTKRLEKQHREFKERTHNLSPEMREEAWRVELEQGWQEIEDTVLSFRVADDILNGGRFDTLSLGTWMSIAQAADITYVPIALAGMAHLTRTLQDGQPIVLDLPSEASQYAGVVRLDCCGSASLKGSMSFRGSRDHGPIAGAYQDGEQWLFRLDDRTTNGLMNYVGQVLPNSDVGCPIWWRPWVNALEIDVARPAFMGRYDGDKWPMEWRAIVQGGKLAGITAYYTQAPILTGLEVERQVSDVAAQVDVLLSFMSERGIQPWHPRYIGDGPETDVSFTCDFISTPGGAAFLEAGPRVPVNEWNVPVADWGAHPCCFEGKAVTGLALSKSDAPQAMPSRSQEAGERG